MSNSSFEIRMSQVVQEILLDHIIEVNITRHRVTKFKLVPSEHRPSIMRS